MFCVSRKGGTGGGGWGHPQGAVHMAAARLGCKMTVVGTGWANSWPGCMSRLRKCYSHLSGGSFLAGKASWALSGCLPIESADHCMLVNPLGPIAPKGARLTLYSFVASHFAVPFPRELTLLLAVCWFSPSLKL